MLQGNGAGRVAGGVSVVKALKVGGVGGVQRKSVHKCFNLMHMFYFYDLLVTNYCIKDVFYDPVESMSLSTALQTLRGNYLMEMLGGFGWQILALKNLQFHVGFSCTDLLFRFPQEGRSFVMNALQLLYTFRLIDA